MKPLHVASWGMKSWRGIWSPSGKCFQEINCFPMFLFKNKLYYLYQCPPSQMLSGRSSRSAYKTLWAKSILQQHHNEKTANKSHFVKLGSLLLVRARSICRSVKLGHKSWSEEKPSKVRLNPWTGGQALINEGNNLGTTPTCLIPNLPRPKNWLTLTRKGKSPRKAGNVLGGHKAGKEPRMAGA